jgi:hypothetical protein
MAADTCDGSAATGLSRFLPETMEGFTPAGPDRTFTSETLFELIDGGAEVYRALNLRRTVHRRYSHPDENDILADVFDMGSSNDAYGAYHNDIREAGTAGFGCESEYQGGTLNFWKDRYYVSVVAIFETERSARAVLAIGRAVAEAIPGDAPPPELTERLPAEGLLAEQIYYFHDHHGLARRYRLGDGNPLLLHAGTEGLLARYRSSADNDPDAPPLVLLLVEYPSAEEAESAHRNFRSAHVPRWRDQAAVKLVGGGWTASDRLEKTVAVVLGAADRHRACRLLGAVRATLPDHEEDRP